MFSAAAAYGASARYALPLVVKIAPLTGKVRYHPRIINRFISLQLQRNGDQTEVRQIDTDGHNVETPTPLADC